MVKPNKISNFKPLFTNLAQTSHFLVEFGISHNIELSKYLKSRGVDVKFVAESAGLLVRDAILPTTAFATIESYDHLGITKKFAHNRQFTEMNMEIYVDSDYKTIKFFEHWMEFIASGSHNQSLVKPSEKKPEISIINSNYITRYQYPIFYKSNSTKIVKFERNYNKEIEYNFLGLFPKSMNSISVSYESSSIMTLGVTFEYDRYIPGKISSLSQSRKIYNNLEGSTNDSKGTGPNSVNIINLNEDEIVKIYKNFNTDVFSKDSLSNLGGILNKGESSDNTKNSTGFFI